MGNWASVTLTKKTHIHEIPTIIDYGDSCVGPGSIWQCACGQEWVVVQVKTRGDEARTIWNFSFFGKDYGFVEAEGLGH